MAHDWSQFINDSIFLDGHAETSTPPLMLQEILQQIKLPLLRLSTSSWQATHVDGS